jgi:hypothetical protein
MAVHIKNVNSFHCDHIPYKNISVVPIQISQFDTPFYSIKCAQNKNIIQLQNPLCALFFTADARCTAREGTHLRFFACCFASFSLFRFIQGFLATLSLPELPCPLSANFSSAEGS